MIIRNKPERPESVLLTDLETTGLSPKKCVPIQIAAIKVVHSPEDYLDMELTCVMEYKLALPNGVEVPEVAAKLNGYSEKKWAKEAVSRKEAYTEYLKELQWSSFGGQNPKFDWNFLDEDFARTGFEWPRLSYYGLVSVDTMARPLKLLGYTKSLKQQEIAKFFGLGEQTHDALDDIRQAAEIYRRCCWLEKHGFTESNLQQAVSMKSEFI